MRARLLALLLLVLLPPAGFAATIEDAEAAVRRGDYASAIPLYTSLAQAGNAQAMLNLGRLYQKGEGVARDLSRAVAYYTDAAARGNADAQFNLGNLYLLGEGVQQDDDWAFTYYRLAAQQGHALAQKNVNEFYRAAGLEPPPLTLATPQSPAITAPPAPPMTTDTSAPTTSANTIVGEVPAQYSEDELRAMEMARAVGIRIEMEPGAAFILPPPTPAMESAAPPPPPALAEIKRRLAAGETTQVERDLERLAAAGNVEAQFMLSRLLVTLQRRTDGEALLWLKQAARGGHAEAQYVLAEAYRRGNGTPQDEAEAVTWYRVAARQGHAGARQQLDALYHEAGLLTPATSGAPRRSNVAPAR